MTDTVPLQIGLFRARTSGVYAPSYDQVATNDLWDFPVLAFKKTTQKESAHAAFVLPVDFPATLAAVDFEIQWTSVLTSGTVTFDIDYRIVGGDDTESLDEPTPQQGISAIDSAPSSVNRRMTQVIPASGANFSSAGGKVLQLILSRDCPSETSGIAGEVIVVGLTMRASSAQQQLPLAPTGLVGVAGPQQVALSWNTSANTDSYRVKRATVSGGPYSLVASPAATSHVDSPLTNGTTYFHVVSGVNSVGEGPNSAQTPGHTPFATSTGGFKVIIGSRHSDRPDFNSLHANLYWGSKTSTKLQMQDFSFPTLSGCTTNTPQPTQSQVQSEIRNHAPGGTSYTGTVILDVECWLAGHPNHVDKYFNILNWSQQALPNARVWYYDVLPRLNLFMKPGDTTSSGYLAWHQQMLNLQRSWDITDGYSPTFYHRSTNLQQYSDFTTALVDEINRFNRGSRPIIPFLNPRYATGVSNPPGIFAPVPYADFLFALNHLSSSSMRSKGVEGVYVWMEQGSTWQSKWGTLPWWQAVQDFVGFTG